MKVEQDLFGITVARDLANVLYGDVIICRCADVNITEFAGTKEGRSPCRAGPVNSAERPDLPLGM